MAISIATNDQNDIYLDKDSNLAMVRNLFAVEQDAEHAMKALLGEMVLATQNGMPYFETAWDNLDITQFTGYAYKTILSVPDVTDILTFEVLQEGDVLKYQAGIVTTYGEGLIRG